MDLRAFLKRLKALPSVKGAFNPWHSYDRANDTGPGCPAIRCRQLAGFLASRIGTARILILGEASGYQGAHFSGIPMTSERILEGTMRPLGLTPEMILPGIKPRRTSKPAIKPGGFSEPTATIVWGAVRDSGLDPRKVCVWNTVPQHLYDPAKGMLSNRTPTSREIDTGLKTLTIFLELFPGIRLIAMGNAAASGLTALGLRFVKVRHPARGGSRLFREQMRSAW